MSRRWLIGLAAVGCAGTAVEAGDFRWTDASSGAWADPAMWTPSGVPGAVSPVGSSPTPNDDVAIIDATGAAYVVAGDARNVGEIRLNSASATLNFSVDAGLRTDRLVYGSGTARVTINHEGHIAVVPVQPLTGYVELRSAGSVSMESHAVPENMTLRIESSAQSAGVPIVLTIPTGPLATAGVPALGSNIASSVYVSPGNGLQGSIDANGAALLVSAGGALFFQGPAIAEPHHIDGSVYMRGWGRFEVDTRIDQGLFMQGGDVRVSTGRVLSTPTLRWGRPGDGPTTPTGDVRGDVTLTRADQPAELAYGTASLSGRLTGGLHIHASTTLVMDGELNGDLQIDGSGALVPNEWGSRRIDINGRAVAQAGSIIDVTPLQSAPVRVTADEFAGSTTLRLRDTSGRPPEPGIYRGVLEMTEDDLPAGFVAGIDYNTSWVGLSAWTQVDPTDGGLLDLFITARPGDANVDGLVGFVDLLVVAKNYNYPSSSWFRGDFDHDGVTGFSDLLVVAQQYGLPAAEFAQEWNLAMSTVPEPTAAMGVASMMVLLARRVRRGV